MAATITHFKQLLDEIITIQDINQFKQDLDLLSNSLFKTHANLKRKINQLFTPYQSQLLYKILTSKKINFVKNAESGQEFIQDLQAYLDSLPILHLTLATLLPQQNLMQISDWLNTDTKSKIILDIVIDKNIIGGILIYQNGIYKDYSLKNQLDNTINQYVKI